MKKIIPLFLFLIIFGVIPQAFAETKTVTTTGKFVMGDLDSKSDAKNVALMNAKRMALEEAGTYLTSLTEVKNYELSQDEISSLAAGIICVEILDEKWTMEGESLAVVLTIKATINTDDLDNRINSMKENKDVVEDFKTIQAELDQLKQELEKIKAQGDKADSSKEVKSTVASVPTQSEAGTINRMIALEDLKNANWKLTTGDARGAINDLNKVIDRAPDNFFAYMTRSRALAKLGRTSAAVKDINAAIKIKPGDAKAHLIKGRLLMKNGKPDLALKSYSRAIELKPDCGQCYFERGNILLKLRKFREARFDLKRSCELGIQRGCEKSRVLANEQRELQQNSTRDKNRRIKRPGR